MKQWLDRITGKFTMYRTVLILLLAVTANAFVFSFVGVIFYKPLELLVSGDTSEGARDLHEDWFNVVLVLIILHIAAILYYRLIRGKKLAGAMITGKSALDPGAEPMRPGKWWAGLLCLAVAIGFTRWIIAGVPPFGG